MAGNTPAPWDSSSVAYLAETIIEPTYTVKLWAGSLATGARVAIPAYDVQVALSATSVPFGTANFKTPIPPWSGVTWPTGSLTLNNTPFTITTVEILAGYRHLIGGTMTDDQQTLMFGYVTSMEIVRQADGTAYVQWEVATVDALYEYPSHRTYSPTNTFTRLKQVTDAWIADADPWYIAPALIEGTLNTPTSTQLTSFRTCDIGIGDTVGDYFRTLAQILGQRVLPDWRSTNLRLRVDVEPDYVPGSALTLAGSMEVRQLASQDRWGDILNLKANWYSSGDQKTSTRQFPYPGIFPVNPPIYGRPVAVVQEATIWTKPPGGVIPTDSSWGPTALWLRRINTRKRLTQTVTSRAAYWIQPFDVINFTTPGVTVYVDSVRFQLDSGTMVVTGGSAS